MFIYEGFFVGGDDVINWTDGAAINHEMTTGRAAGLITKTLTDNVTWDKSFYKHDSQERIIPAVLGDS